MLDRGWILENLIIARILKNIEAEVDDEIKIWFYEVLKVLIFC